MVKLVFNSIDSKQAIKSETYTEQTYNFLRAAILRRELKENEVYSQDQVSAMLNISRTPVREALLALQKEGYIRFLRGRGFEIVPYDIKEVRNIAETRMVVEKAAAGFAAERITRELTDAMLDNVRTQEAYVHDTSVRDFNVEYYLQLDDEFHKLILRAAGNNTLSKVTEDMRSQWMRGGYSILQFGANRQEIALEHRAIFNAIYSGNVQDAEQAMATHMLNTQKRHLKNDDTDIIERT